MIIMTVVCCEAEQQGLALIQVSHVDVVPHTFGRGMNTVAVIIDDWMTVVNFEETFTFQIDDVLGGDAVEEVRVIKMLHDRNTCFFSLLYDCIQVALHYLLQRITTLRR